MGFEIAKVGDDPIIVETMHTDFSLKNDLPTSIDQLQVMLDGVDEPHTFIIDATNAHLTFGDAIAGMASVTRGSTAVFKHPNLRQLLVVTSSNLVELTTRAFGQEQYGGVRSETFGSLDEAIEYARAQTLAS